MMRTMILARLAAAALLGTACGADADNDSTTGDSQRGGSGITATLVDASIVLVDASAPGTTTALSMELASGAYVVICNIPSHYDAGMSASLAVR